MSKYYLFLLPLIFFISSCQKYDEAILPMVGTYEAIIFGNSGTYNIGVSSGYGSDIFIDAPWDAQIFDEIEAEVKDKDSYRKRIKIKRQELEPGIEIWGEGVFYDYTIQLDYSIDFGGLVYDYTMVANKY